LFEAISVVSISISFELETEEIGLRVTLLTNGAETESDEFKSLFYEARKETERSIGESNAFAGVLASGLPTVTATFFKSEFKRQFGELAESKGITGKEKETYSNVLDFAGVKNKYGELECGPCKSTSEKETGYYPTLYLSSKEAPMLVGTDVEDEVTLIIKAKIVSHSLNERANKKNENFDLEIRKIGVVSTNKNNKK
jgi:hypothetical protein